MEKDFMQAVEEYFKRGADEFKKPISVMRKGADLQRAQMAKENAHNITVENIDVSDINNELSQVVDTKLPTNDDKDKGMEI